MIHDKDLNIFKSVHEIEQNMASRQNFLRALPTIHRSTDKAKEINKVLGIYSSANLIKSKSILRILLAWARNLPKGVATGEKARH